MEDRRASSRTGADWPVKIITSESSTEGEVRNVSSKGVFIQCTKPLSPKEKCLLMIELPSERGLVEFQGEVVWSTPPAADDESRPRGMGGRFLW